LQRLSADCGEAFNFSVLDGHEVGYVARSASNRMESIGFAVSARVPAHLVTPGIAMLSTFSVPALEAWAAVHEFNAFTQNSAANAQQFLQTVAAARHQGYWTSEGLLTLGLRGIAMPVKDRKGECRGAIGSTMPAQPYTHDEMVQRFLPRLTEVANVLRDLV